MAIVLTPEHKQAIELHGEETFPNECCGFLFGTTDGTHKAVISLRRAANAREGEDQHNRFLIDPRDFMLAEKEARTAKLDVIGIYHSHPDDQAIASQYDLEHAWPWYSYVIVSIMSRKADQLLSWVLREDRSAFDSEEVVVESE